MPYLTPDSIPEDDDCRPLSIPADSAWLALFGGALTELTKPYNWQKFGALTVNETVAKMQEIIDNWYVVACGGCELPTGTPPFRLTETGEIQQYDGTEWVTPNGDYTIPPAPSRSEPTAEERRCLAAANAADVFARLYEEVSDAVNDGETSAEIVARIVAFVIAAIGSVFGLITLPLITFLLALYGAYLAIARFVTADLWDEEFTAVFRCMLFSCAEDIDGVVHFDFECVLEHLSEESNVFNLSLDQLRLFGQIAFMMNIVGSQGLDAMGATTEVEEADCEACDWWRYCFDFTDGDMFSFEQIPTLTMPGAFWTGDGWNSVFVDVCASIGDNFVGLNIGRSMPTMELRKVVARFVGVEYDVLGLFDGYVQFTNSGGALTTTSNDDGSVELVWEGDLFFGGAWGFQSNSIFGYRHCATGNATGFGRLKYIRFEGKRIDDVHPFDEDNC